MPPDETQRRIDDARASPAEIKRAHSDHPIEPWIAQRWSPRAFAERPVEREKLASVLEAARWAPSCFNEQPWRFFVAAREDVEGFERLASALVAGNAWAKRAPVLLLAAASTRFARDGSQNRHAWHDVGLALANLVLQAEALGLGVHMMAGFDPARAREALGLPESLEPATMAALGYRGDPESLPEPLRQRELAPRTRKPLSEIAFGAGFGTPL